MTASQPVLQGPRTQAQTQTETQAHTHTHTHTHSHSQSQTQLLHRAQRTKASMKMPPARNQASRNQPLVVPGGSMKPAKTERTHEENQERAYIAASRRSDRSLEARVESARRASEIHRRRTGRGLRVTEADVMNEEMYEEEDDGFPRQYLQLAAHLQSGNREFNSRLEAYLTSNVAIRSALEKTIWNSYVQQGLVSPYTPQFAGNFPSPMLAHQYQQPAMQKPMQLPQQPPQPPQQQPQPPQPQQQYHYRQAPYPSPRSHSIAAPSIKPETSTSAQVSPLLTTDNRRMSLPVTPATTHASAANTPASPSGPIPNRNSSFPQGLFALDLPHRPATQASAANTTASPSASTPRQHPAFPHHLSAQELELLAPQAQRNINLSQNNTGTTFGPLSTALPNDAATFCGSQFTHGNPSPPNTDESVGGFNWTNNDMPQTNSMGNSQMYPSMTGLNSTLSSAGETYPNEVRYQTDGFFNDAMASGSGVTPSFDNEFFNFDNFGEDAPQ
ncbi:hypothetical protein LZ554_003796 [Drepanopeziza brunnea f. sp. 'monogermtubi']|nr:hypothetical protein LZ554_003796 [Drepanopeziza brunnea f. sp. 'monogermtubi']